MGVWGTGLYSGDFAMDLRSTVLAVLRLPLEPPRLVEILRGTESSAADDPGDEDHATFWLVVADQFAKKGVARDEVRDRALRIIEDGQDTSTLQALGMRPSDIRRRIKVLEDLKAKISRPGSASRPRTVLKKPQALLMEVGEALVYPTCKGRCVNPYYPSREKDWQYTREGPIPWEQDGWGAMVVVDRGRAFDFLSWYRAVTLAVATAAKPSLDALRGDVLWRLGLPGTCSASHFRKMELEKVGSFPIDSARLRERFPGLRPGISAAVSDISISNSMAAAPSVPRAMIPRPRERRPGVAPTLSDIGEILVR